MTHFCHVHRLDVMEFNPIECNIYSFYYVGQDVSMEMEIEPIYDSFDNYLTLKLKITIYEIRRGKLRKHSHLHSSESSTCNKRLMISSSDRRTYSWEVINYEIINLM